LSASEDDSSLAAVRVAVARFHPRLPLCRAVGTLVLLAMVPTAGYAEGNANASPDNTGQVAPADRGPVVIPPFQLGKTAPPTSRPVVVPKVGNAREPVAPVRGQMDGSAAQRPVRPDAADTLPQRSLFRPEPDGNRNPAIGFREPNGFEALYRATHFRGGRPRGEPGLFGAPDSGLLTAGCGVKGGSTRRMDEAAERCLAALAFVVSPPPATRGVLPRNLPTISPRDAQPIPPVAAVKPVPPPMLEQDPFEPRGFTAGNFLFKPAVEMSTGYDSNPGRTPGGPGSAVVVVAPVLVVRSQFDRHALNADLRASYVDDTKLQQLSHPTVDARVNGRYDFTDTMALNAEGHLAVDADDPGTARFTGIFSRIPLVTTVGGSAGFAQKFGDLQVQAKGTADHLSFQDAPVIGGGVIRNGDRNFSQYGGQTRVTYAVTPEISPFVDVAVDRRIHDLPVDFNGFRRDSTGTAAEVGVTFGYADRLTGDVAIGYLVRQYQDIMLRPVGAFIADANLAWQLNKENILQFGAKSQVVEIAEVGTSGVLKRDVTVEYDHQFEPWLTGTLATGYGQDAFVGTIRVDNRYFVDIGLQYKVSRLLQLRANLREEETRSNVPINNLAATVATVGARVQY
jgi:hypothetical protein